MPTLRIHMPGAAPTEVELEGVEFRLGRSEDCEIMVDEGDVSRQHAVLRRAGPRWEIEDLGSRNGVFVNDQKVSAAEVGAGDVIRLGRNVELELVATAAAYLTRDAGPSRASRGGGFSPLGWLMHDAYGLETSGGRGGRGRGDFIALGSSAVVGREKGAGVMVDDESVSRVHARIDRDAQGLVVTDLKSRNGVLVNGEPMMQSPLEPGDIVQFGDVPFTVVRRRQPNWRRLWLGTAGVATLVVVAFGVQALVRQMNMSAEIQKERGRVKRQALLSLTNGIEAWNRGEADFARGYLLNAADFLQLGGLAPPGATLDRPAELFRPIARELPESQREFDFAAALDPRSSANVRARLSTMSDAEFIAHETRRIASEMGQDSEVPDAFIAEVSDYVHAFVERDRGTFQKWLERSRTLQPRMKALLAEAHLPEVFCYVAWVESGLNPSIPSHAGALGLWQLMIPTAREMGLVVDPGHGVDERLDPTKATQAAAKYFAWLLRRFGSEQMMCAIASYNRGPGGVQNAMNKIEDPLYPSSKRYWYLVEHRLLPEETSKYVPKIFAVAILASSPERFGFQAP